MTDNTQYNTDDEDFIEQDLVPASQLVPPTNNIAHYVNSNDNDQCSSGLPIIHFETQSRHDTDQPWYYSINRDSATKFLQNQQPGTFMVR